MAGLSSLSSGTTNYIRPKPTSGVTNSGGGLSGVIDQETDPLRRRVGTPTVPRGGTSSSATLTGGRTAVAGPTSSTTSPVSSTGVISAPPPTSPATLPPGINTPPGQPTLPPGINTSPGYPTLPPGVNTSPYFKDPLPEDSILIPLLPDPSPVRPLPPDPGPVRPQPPTPPPNPSQPPPGPYPGQGYGNWNQYDMYYNPGVVSEPNTANQYKAGQLGQFDSSQAYQAGQTPTMDVGAQYQAGQLPSQGLPTYATSQFNQYTAPDQGVTQSAANQAMQNALANPESLGPQVVAQLKEKQKEQVLAMQDQLRQQYGQSAASRGTTGGGDLNVLNRQLNDSAVGEITQGQRLIDMTAAQTNFNDRLNTIAAANAAMTSEAGRAGQNYGLGLQGQQAQAGENYQGWNTGSAAAQFGLQQALEQQGLNQAQAASTGQFNQQRLAASAQSEANKQAQSGQAFQWQQADIDRQLAQQGLNQAQAQSGQAWDQQRLQAQLANEELKQAGAASGLSANQLALQAALGEGGLNLDIARFNEGQRQFDTTANMDYQRFLDSSAQWRGQLGFNYAELDQKMKQWLADSLK